MTPSPKPAAHTPGPWTLCYDGQIDGPKGETICRFTWDSFGEFNKSPSEKANARLIAAAPDLLAALKMAHRHISPLAYERGTPSYGVCIIVQDALAAAIAKAEGK